MTTLFIPPKADDESVQVEEMAEKLYGILGDEQILYKNLFDSDKQLYRQGVEVILSSVSLHMAELLKMFANRIHVAEHKSVKLADMLHDTREWALESDKDAKELAALLREAREYVARHALIGEGGLRDRIDKKLAEIENG